MSEPLRALSIRQPWAWAVLHAGKNVENRKAAPPSYLLGQPFLLHASKGCGREEWGAAGDSILAVSGQCPPLLEQLDRGGIVGVAWLTGWSREGGDWRMENGHDPVREIHRSPWFSGPVGYLLEHVQPLPFTPCAGALGFWRVPPRVLEQLAPDLDRALDRIAHARLMEDG
jgi:hypothetical protein